MSPETFPQVTVFGDYLQELQAKAALFDKMRTACEAAQTTIYDAMHAGNLSREYHYCVAEKLDAVLAEAKKIHLNT